MQKGKFIMNINYGNINNIINRINSIKSGSYSKNRVCVLLGAGADISSGGVLFRELKIRFLKENGCIVPSNIDDKSLDKEFEDQIEKMSQDSRCETLDKIMRTHKKPSEGYLLLIMLADMGFIDAVITTNFDYLLEETQTQLNSSPFTIFTPGRAIPEEYYLHRNKISPLYLKMHGDLSDRLVTHLTQKEIHTKQYGEKFINLFEYIIQNYSLIIVGYAGYDSLITDIVKKNINHVGEIYWCNICAPNDDSALANALENKLYYINTSFDNLFQELAKNLLRDVKLKNANPVFLPTVVQSKIDNQLTIFKEKFEYSDKLVKRTTALETLDHYLASFSNKCIAVIGENKFGKSCFVYKVVQSLLDIVFFPVFFEKKNSILESMAQALGYDTDVPFPVMYNFLKWWDKTKRQLVFIIDDFFSMELFRKSTDAQIKDFFNFLYIVREFRYVQFVICFQSCIFDELDHKNTFSLFGNIISQKIDIGKFSEEELTELVNKNGSGENIVMLKKQELLFIPYVWEIINRNNIILSEKTDFFAQYIDVIYDASLNQYDFTKHALNKILRKLAYKQLFEPNQTIDTTSQEYIFLTECEIIDSNGNIIYPELTIYFCKQYFLSSGFWENVVSEIIIPDLQGNTTFSDSQLDVYFSILAEIDNIDKYDVVLQNVDRLIMDQSESLFIRKVVIKVLRKCMECNTDLFESYLRNIEINTYSFQLQYYLFKVCAELCPSILKIWNKASEDSKLPYAAFVLCDDILYKAITESLNRNQLNMEIPKFFNEPDGLIKLCHILTYWGWDNTPEKEYLQLKNLVSKEIIPIVKTDDSAVQYFVGALKKYAYNIFFNAGEDFEEQFFQFRSSPISELIKRVLNKKFINKDDYLVLLEANIDINNSWLFIISNIVMVQSMKNQPDETYNMLYHFWDNVQLDVKVQHLDFYLSSVFWSLYLNMPYDRKNFTAIFEMVVEKYERVLFMFPTTKRISSLHKFKDEFNAMFEDGFNPLAFYFYTAPYESLTTSTDWDCGKTDLKVYWDLASNMSKLGKFDEMLRIVHALGQMISIYPEEGYSALENLTEFNQPIIKKGIIRIFKENYLRFSEVTKKELEKAIYHFDSNEVDEIIYNSDFLLENRTMEQLHWGRLFYNLEQLSDINVSERFLSIVLQSSSCLGFLHDFISSFLK